ncbi:peptide deformylase [Plantactinospora sp. GCM10030261]|uniref:peptide deformylase n=1 Tax=Plantactinospora sp. GCM10030261 TaxID=3273420 RepID=UPI00360E326E
MTLSPLDRAADSFAAELSRRRVARGMTKKQLAARMGFDPSYVSHVEGRRHRPTEDFARRAEAVLGASGAIWQRFQEYDELRQSRPVPSQRRPTVSPEQWLPPGTGLLVEHETATLTYADGQYRCRIRRQLYNGGNEPVSRYLIRVAVDRFPHEPDRSNRHHREHPLSFDELGLRAWCKDDGRVEAMECRVKRDRDAFKEAWLLFENNEGRFPLYPRRRATIEYTYAVSEEKWGQWFQRAVRLPTGRLTIALDLPAGLDPQVWGVEASLSTEETPLRTPIDRRVEGERVRFEWSTDYPQMHSRYQLEWRFRAPEVEGVPDEQPGERASDRMRSAGILQRGSEMLHRPTTRFDLPREEPAARAVVSRLLTVLDKVDELHPFSKGVGLSAPQIGVARSAAVIHPPDREAEPVVLLNPRVVDAGPETDEQYEGCLSFFDVRGLVPRALRVDVEHVQYDGSPVITSFDLGMARLVAHEIDHLEGRLYVDRMAAGVPLVSVEEYRETGQPWHY